MLTITIQWQIMITALENIGKTRWKIQPMGSVYKKKGTEQLFLENISMNTTVLMFLQAGINGLLSEEIGNILKIPSNCQKIYFRNNNLKIFPADISTTKLQSMSQKAFQRPGRPRLPRDSRSTQKVICRRLVANPSIISPMSLQIELLNTSKNIIKTKHHSLWY